MHIGIAGWRVESIDDALLRRVRPLIPPYPQAATPGECLVLHRTAGQLPTLVFLQTRILHTHKLTSKEIVDHNSSTADDQ